MPDGTLASLASCRLCTTCHAAQKTVSHGHSRPQSRHAVQHAMQQWGAAICHHRTAHHSTRRSGLTSLLSGRSATQSSSGTGIAPKFW